MDKLSSASFATSRWRPARATVCPRPLQLVIFYQNLRDAMFVAKMTRRSLSRRSRLKKTCGYQARPGDLIAVISMFTSRGKPRKLDITRSLLPDPVQVRFPVTLVSFRFQILLSKPHRSSNSSTSNGAPSSSTSQPQFLNSGTLQRLSSRVLICLACIQISVVQLLQQLSSGEPGSNFCL